MTKPLIILILAAAVFAGCTREENHDPDGKGVEIRFTLPHFEQQKDPQHGRQEAPALAKALADAPHQGSTLSEATAPHPGDAVRNLQPTATRALLDERATVRVVAYKAVSGVATPQSANYVADQTYVADAAGVLSPCTVNADGSFAAAAAGAALRLVAGEYDFFAITPALPLDATHTKTDVPNGIDYATSRTEAIKILPADNTKNVTLKQLQRQCARIILLVQKDPEYTSLNLLQVDGADTKQGVTIGGLAPAVSGAMLGAALTHGTGAEGNKLVFPASKFAQTDATTVTITTCVLPKTAADLALSYDLVLGKNIAGTQTNTQRSLSGTVPAQSLIAGNSYRLILTVGSTAATLTVDQWDDGGNSNNDMGN